MKQQLKLESVRDRIARDLHDELGSTLSSISLYSTVAQNNFKDAPSESKEVLEKISQSTTSVMEAMNDIVWAVKVDNDKLEELINRMRNFSVELTEHSNITLHFQADENLEGVKTEMVLRRNLYLIFKEAINNAIKYAKGENLWVILQLDSNKLKMVIRDDGKGFDLDAVDSGSIMGGNGLNNMQKRAEELKAELEIKTSNGRGTELTFAVKLS
jgi:signal transduction histidine kinase